MRNKYLILVILLGLILRIIFIQFDILFLIEKTLSDDMFYFLKIAKNFALYKIISFDGVNPTNGFQPLYMFVLSFIFKIFPSEKIIPIKIALFIISLFNIFTAIILFYLSKELLKKETLIPSILYLFNPYILFISFSGTEVALSSFFIILTVFIYIILLQKNSVNSLNFIVLGAITSIAFLSRIDNIFLFLAILFHMFYKKTRFRIIFLYCFSFFVLILPYLSWNLINFNMLLPVSGSAIFYNVNSKYFLGNQILFIELLKDKFENLVSFCGRTVRYLGLPLIVPDILLIILFIFSLIVVFLIYKKEKVMREIFHKLNFLNIFIGLIIISYSFLFGWAQMWYFLSILTILTLYMGIIVDYLIKFSKIKWVWYLIIIFLFLLSFQNLIERGINPWQREMYIISIKVKDRVKETERIASFNAGIFGYFSDRKVFNIDGVVNNEVFFYMKKFGRKEGLVRYLQDEKIKYLLDEKPFYQFFLPYKKEFKPYKIILEEKSERSDSAFILLKID